MQEKQVLDEAKAIVEAEQRERANRVLVRIQGILKEENCLLSIKPMVTIEGKQPAIVVLAR